MLFYLNICKNSIFSHQNNMFGLINLKTLKYPEILRKDLKILVAGCGTGAQLQSVAYRKNAKILAFISQKYYKSAPSFGL